MLLCIELSDVVFAVDSIPAVFAVTKVSPILGRFCGNFPNKEKSLREVEYVSCNENMVLKYRGTEIFASDVVTDLTVCRLKLF